MKRFVFKNTVVIPDHRKHDVNILRKFIMCAMRICISQEDTYLLWDKVSDAHEAGWLDIEYHYDHQTREEFLLDCMEDYGMIKEMN